MEGEKDEEGKLKLLRPQSIPIFALLSSRFISAFFVPIYLLLLLNLIQLIGWSLVCSVFPLWLFNSPPHPTFLLPFFCCSSKRCFVIRGHETVCFLLLQSLTSDSFALTDSSLQDIRSCLARQLASFNAHHWSRNSLAHTTWSYDGKLVRILIKISQIIKVSNEARG